MYCMETSEVIDAVRNRWPSSEYVQVPEAPNDARRQGRKIDMLFISMWASRGYQRVAVEVKVSMGDFRRELKNPAKAEWWWGHTHEFWIACPTSIVSKVLDEAPLNWGVLAVSDDGKTRARRKPQPNVNAEPLPEEVWVGVVRAAEDAGPGQLIRAESLGFNRGHERGVEVTERKYRNGVPQEILGEIEAITSITGAPPSRLYEGWGNKIVAAYNLVSRWDSAPETLISELRLAAANSTQVSKRAEQIAGEIESLFR